MSVRITKSSEGEPVSIPDSWTVSVPLVAGTVDTLIYIASQPTEVVAVRECHSGAGAGSSTLDVKKCTGTTAPASGTTVLGTVFALDSTINTPVTKKHDGAAAGTRLTSTVANRKLVAGDRLAIDMTGTITSLVGVVTVQLRKLQTAGGMQ